MATIAGNSALAYDSLTSMIIYFLISPAVVALLFARWLVNSRYRTALKSRQESELPVMVIAVAAGDDSKVQELIQAEAKVNKTGPDSRNALMLAARNGQNSTFRSAANYKGFNMQHCMRVLALCLSLIWRTVVAYFLLALPALLLLYLLGLLGFDPRPDEQAAAVVYIKAKPTMIYFAFAAVLFTLERWLHINLLRLLWGHRLQIVNETWRTVITWLSLLSLALAVLNGAVAAFASIEAWIAYKLFGGLSILLLGHLFLARHVLATRGK
jgi:hypothetical protein